MKKIVSILLILCLLLGFSGCSPSVSATEMEATLAQFMDALKIYDREAMTACLDVFPDSSGYVYLDDIYNDEGYMELYRLTFGDLEYTIQETEKNTVTIRCKNSDIQTLYTNVTSTVLQMAMTDPTLQNKLNEDEENGIVLVRELMLSFAREKKNLEQSEDSYTLSFKKENGKVYILCDDELRCLITGRFFLSKNMLVSDLED